MYEKDCKFRVAVLARGKISALQDEDSDLVAGTAYTFTATIYVDGVPQPTSANWTIIGNVHCQKSYDAQVNVAVVGPASMLTNPTDFMFSPALPNQPIINFSIMANMQVTQGAYAGLTGQKTKSYNLRVRTGVGFDGPPRTGNVVIYKTDANNWYMSLGDPVEEGVYASIKLPAAPGEGKFGLIQLVSSLRYYKNTATGDVQCILNTNGMYFLDAGSPPQVIYASEPADEGFPVNVVFKDSPRMQCPSNPGKDPGKFDQCYVTETFRIYPMFQPDGGAWVPVSYVVQWGWLACALWNENQGEWGLGTCMIKGPRFMDTIFEFPLWSKFASPIVLR
ncbi:hypothetical protein [Sorangium sp. So ce341]|uniref:hypothetical protein n=1 Tax=Sorangium sp. So ce341 TaxID=3133302 RepID=UPI003F632427